MSTSQQPSSMLGRGRSTRQTANTGKALHGPAGSMNKAAPVSHSVAVPRTELGPSNLSLFLTNLRLLDLDLRPDWPGINIHTLSARDAAQGQKRRVQCVEWALYHLFVIWDPEETRNKLQPFFPPVDQVQSLSLRAALLRCLDQAKKTGVLGRDAVVRKTMLDECRGERFEEVLAVFSSAVLKMAIAKTSEGIYPAVAQMLALENRGYKEERGEVKTLALVHKASLARLVREKRIAAEQFRDFAELLGLKEKSIARRLEYVKANQGLEGEGTVSEDAKLDIWRMVRNNWSGDERWMESLLYGDANSRRDGLLSTPFDKVWRRVRCGRLSELEDQSGGLLEKLDGRVRMQQERLAQWQDFHKKLFEGSTSGTTDRPSKSQRSSKGLDLGFGIHENLHLGRISPRKLRPHQPPKLDAEYANLVEQFEQELVQARKSQPLDLGSLSSTHERKRPVSLAVEPAEEVISELSDLSDDFGAAKREGPPLKTKADNSQRRGNPALADPVSTSEKPSWPEQPSHTPVPSNRSPRKQFPAPPVELTSPETSPTRSPRRVRTSPSRSPLKDNAPSSPNKSPSRQPRAFGIQPPPQTPQVPTSPTQAMADQILEFMNNSSPSPTKKSKPRHTLSLAERTRLSMARTSHAKYFVDTDEDDEPESYPLKHATPDTTSTPVMADPKESDEHEDLVARTRKSMAGFEAAKQKAQLERRKSERKPNAGLRRERSQFPKVEEETTQIDRSLLAEELMGDGDYEAVFKSRPRIKTSPAPSPSKTWEAEE